MRTLAVIPSSLDETGDFNGEPARTRLSTDFKLLVGSSSCLMHVHLIQVDDDGIAINPELREDVARLAEMNGCDPAELEQITIGDRYYVAVITPYAE